MRRPQKQVVGGSVTPVNVSQNVVSMSTLFVLSTFEDRLSHATSGLGGFHFLVEISGMGDQASTSVQDGWFLAAKMGREDDLQVLIKNISDVSVQDELGNTALHYAAQANHRTCVDVLIQAKANINVQNKAGETPAHKV